MHSPQFPLQENDGDHWANNTITGEPYRTYCTLCPAGMACNTTGLTAPDVLCAEGYFCKLGAPDPMPYCQAGEGLCTYGVCPAGHYCPTGTSVPVVCPPGEVVCTHASKVRVIHSVVGQLKLISDSMWLMEGAAKMIFNGRAADRPH